MHYKGAGKEHNDSTKMFACQTKLGRKKIKTYMPCKLAIDLNQIHSHLRMDKVEGY